MNVHNIINSYKYSCIIIAAVDLNLFDILQEPRVIQDFPPEYDRESLTRLLSATISLGLVSVEDEIYRLTSSGRELVSEGSCHALSKITLEQYLPAWSNLSHSIKSGEPAVEQVLEGGVWSRRAEGGIEGDSFIRYMQSIQKYMAPKIISDYDFSKYEKVVDIGGGAGYLIKEILRNWNSAKGGVFDLPHTILVAKETLKEFFDRCEFFSGSFFDDLNLPSADLYILQYILHDWNDDKCLFILNKIKNSAPVGAKLLIIENHSKDSIKDLHMMVMSGGKERTTAEIYLLLKKCGFHGAKKINGYMTEVVI